MQYVETNRINKSNCDEEISGEVQSVFNHELKINGSADGQQTFAPGTTVTITYQDAASDDDYPIEADLVAISSDDDETWTTLRPTKKSQSGARDVIWELTLPNTEDCDVYVILLSTLDSRAGYLRGWYGDAISITCEND